MKIRLVVLAVSAAISITACSSNDSSDAISTSDSVQNNAPILQDTSNSMVALINTGNTSTSSAALWNCSSIAEDGTQTDNIHVRFWLDGTGFSGSKETQWSAVSETELQVTYDGGEFNLTNIAFSTLENDADYFSADDSSGSQVSCNRFGPLRGQPEQTLLLDGSDLQNPLHRMLSTPNPGKWNCDVSENGESVNTVNYELRNDGTGKIDSVDARWYVDTRFNVLISTNTDVVVLTGMAGNEDENAFTANQNQYQLSCQRLPN